MLHPPPAPVATGAVETAFLKLLSHRARVLHSEPVGPCYRILTLGGDDLRDRKWTPGNMVQIALGKWQARAYTPFTYDPIRGRLELLGFVHGHGVGSSWLAAPVTDEPWFVVGPRGGADLETLPRPALLFGDETSISTAAALLATSAGARDVQIVLEVGCVDDARRVLERFGLDEQATVIARQDDDGHLQAIERQLLSAVTATPATRCMLTGKAASIQRLYKALRRVGVSSKRVTNVAYWAPGRQGLSGAQK